MSPSTSGTFEPGYETSDHRQSHRRGCGWARKSWSFWEIALIVAAFIVFWPLGLAALIWKLAKGELWAGSSQSVAPWSRFKGQDLKRWAFRDELTPTSGNSAFDAYKKSELDRLEQERRKLAEEQRAFGEFLDRLKKAKDQDEFDRFMSERRQPPAPATE
ncbi:DUF2852 domain-containing protein [Taklimakanibacter deserti]|uniref:DUF2852 domain-containing protein n=1 Tax=Taklimakanibacter deserti TaxID=2267839 RepID=UPI000E647AF0